MFGRSPTQIFALTRVAAEIVDLLDVVAVPDEFAVLGSNHAVMRFNTDDSITMRNRGPR